MNRGRYLMFISNGPLIIVRLPEKEPRWRDVLRGTKIIRAAHKLRWADVTGIETITDMPRERLDLAFEGQRDILPDFWLYDWCGDSFVIARQGGGS